VRLKRGADLIDDLEHLEQVYMNFLKALDSQKGKQRKTLLTDAHGLVQSAEWFWALKDYDEVAVLYVEAVAIFEEMLGPKCKEVTQLHAWISVAYMWMNNFDGAMKHNKLANKAVFVSHGEDSWEAHRLLVDKAFILEHRFDDSDRLSLSTESRKKFALSKFKSDSIQVKANVLLSTLRDKKIPDNRLHNLSVFASASRRELLASYKGIGGREQSRNRLLDAWTAHYGPDAPNAPEETSRKKRFGRLQLNHPFHKSSHKSGQTLKMVQIMPPAPRLKSQESLCSDSSMLV